LVGSTYYDKEHEIRKVSSGKYWSLNNDFLSVKVLVEGSILGENNSY